MVELKLKMLIIDDSQDLCILWQRLFTSLGWEVNFYNEGKNAIQAIENEEKPDVILCDYFLPDINGLSVLKEIRKKLPTVPMILVTGSRDDVLPVRVKKEVGGEVLHKPIPFSELKNAVIRMLVAANSKA